MSDRMTCIPFKQLLHLILGEYRARGSVFNIPEDMLFRKSTDHSFRIFNERCDTPAGPAAGPHTQLAQNIIASYLAGGRFMELKTVQKMDSLEFDKPCIDARDEAYNTEWSTELSLTEAREEYTKAWIILHLLERVFSLGTDRAEKGFIFNMSIGYDLEGIKTPPMDRFVEGLLDASKEDFFARSLEELNEFTASDAFRSTFGEGAESTDGLADVISPKICRSVTLSTMHGCPPEEQESICRYLLTEKHLPTYVKLNPTLLGYERVRESLDERGFGYIGLRKDTFLHDLQYPAALRMIKKLQALAAEGDLSFGVKLSNTLASVNPGDVLPGEEQYMSGRALFPLTLMLAEDLQRDIPENLPVSFAGGVSVYNAAGLFAAGFRPLTCATELLKPSGYLRLSGIASSIEETADEGLWQMKGVDRDALSRLRESLSGSALFTKVFRGTDRPSLAGQLPVFDCYAAPCVEACPVGQDVPEYIRLTGEGRYADALECIYATNPLPSVTGTICDHQCMSRCTRLDYEGAVHIRDIKRIAAERGAGFSAGLGPPASENGRRAAVIGSGPAGLAAAFFLRRAGFYVSVFEKQPAAGGVVRHVLPSFRIEPELLDRDISRIKAMGVDFHFGWAGSAAALRDEGFDAVFIGIGAEKPRKLSINGSGRVIESLEFLREFKQNPGALSLGSSVAVVGGGNTAMDGARAAARVPGVKTVHILYRRTEDQMPADREEFDNALSDGVLFKPLTLPEGFAGPGVLECRVMALGEEGPDGRRKPVPTDKTVRIEADTVISAVGETADPETLAALGLPVEQGRVSFDEETLETSVDGVFLGGDARTGPSTVVRSMADGKKAAEVIIRRFGGEPFVYPGPSLKERQARLPEIISRRPSLFPPAKPAGDSEKAVREARRCLECHILCNKCVEVCPNRANISVPVSGEDFRNLMQIVHIDAYCNECGNCATFCPYEGKPYRDKITLYSSAGELEAGENPGFSLNPEGTLRVRTAKGGTTMVVKVDNGRVVRPESLDGRFAGVLDTMLTGCGYLINAVTSAKEST